MKKNNDKEFYSNLHPLHGDTINIDLQNPLHVKWRVSASLFQNKKILEAGCGGMAAQAIQLYSYSPSYLLIVDFSKKNIEAAKKIFNKYYPDAENVEFKYIDLGEDPLPKNTFDLIHHRGVFQHIENKDYALNNFKNALNANGRLLFCVYSKGGLLAKTSDLLRYPFKFLNINTTKKILLSIKCPTDLVSAILDHLYVKTQTRYSREEITNYLNQFNFKVEYYVPLFEYKIDSSQINNLFLKWYINKLAPFSIDRIKFISRLLFGQYGHDMILKKT